MSSPELTVRPFQRLTAGVVALKSNCAACQQSRRLLCEKGPELHMTSSPEARLRDDSVLVGRTHFFGSCGADGARSHASSERVTD